MNNLIPPFGPFEISIGLVIYAFFGYCLYRIAQKLNLSDKAWWGFVPILQVLLMLKTAGKPWWWIFLFLIPLVNIVIGILVWINIAQALGKSKWTGVLMLVPGVDLFVLGYLALSK